MLPSADPDTCDFSTSVMFEVPSISPFNLTDMEIPFVTDFISDGTTYVEI
jgi:hypothetical protein